MTTTMSDASRTSAHAVASTADIRAHFPALARRQGAHPVAYFDGPGGTQVPRMVPEAMTQYLLHHNANTHWAYPTSAETDALLDVRSRSTSGRSARTTTSSPAIVSSLSVTSRSVVWSIRTRTFSTSTVP